MDQRKDKQEHRARERISICIHVSVYMNMERVTYVKERESPMMYVWKKRKKANM